MRGLFVCFSFCYDKYLAFTGENLTFTIGAYISSVALETFTEILLSEVYLILLWLQIKCKMKGLIIVVKAVETMLWSARSAFME